MIKGHSVVGELSQTLAQVGRNTQVKNEVKEINNQFILTPVPFQLQSGQVQHLLRNHKFNFFKI